MSFYTVQGENTMKHKRLAALVLGAIFILGGVVVFADSHFGDDDFMHTRLLPENYSVYTSGGAVVNSYYPGLEKRTLGTVNSFRGAPGCYIACYSHNSEKAAYSVGGGMYVMGQIRVAGRYMRRVCNPDNYVNKDISAAQYFKDLCNNTFPEKCTTGCWAGGDTGGWFGIQSDGSIRRRCPAR